MRFVLALLVLALASTASAQTGPTSTPEPTSSTAPLSPPAVAYKEKGTATLLSVVITGGGHFYTGETGTGLTLLGLGIGAPVAGALISASTCDYISNDVCYGGNPAPALIGLGVGLGAWIYGIADSGKSVNRANARNGYAVAVVPTVVPSQQGPQAGLALTARF